MFSLKTLQSGSDLPTNALEALARPMRWHHSQDKGNHYVGFVGRVVELIGDDIVVLSANSTLFRYASYRGSLEEKRSDKQFAVQILPCVDLPTQDEVVFIGLDKYTPVSLTRLLTLYDDQDQRTQQILKDLETRRQRLEQEKLQQHDTMQ